MVRYTGISGARPVDRRDSVDAITLIRGFGAVERALTEVRVWCDMLKFNRPHGDRVEKSPSIRSHHLGNSRFHTKVQTNLSFLRKRVKVASDSSIQSSSESASLLQCYLAIRTSNSPKFNICRLALRQNRSKPTLYSLLRDLEAIAGTKITFNRV